MKIGLIQSCSIGDLIIALPIAQWYIMQGHTVYWPIDIDFYPFMTEAAPGIDFIPAPKPSSDFSFAQALYELPHALLEPYQCDKIFSLYQYFNGASEEAINKSYAESLKFDEYKYAVAGVPFTEKWNLRLRRDMAREKALFEQLNITRPYLLRHQTGRFASADMKLPPNWSELQVVDISEITHNPLDWIYTIENAAKLLMIDSCFANITEQLNIQTEKYLILRSKTPATPVYRNGWKFI